MADTSANCHELDTNWSTVGCSDKRRKFAAPNNEGEYYMNDLPDELLVEILCRLPYCAFVIRCKCVCRRWSCLISSPSFVARFIACRLKNSAPYVENAMMNSNESSGDIILGLDRNDKVMDKEERSFAIIARTVTGCKPSLKWKGVMLHFSDPNLNTHNLSVSPLPCLGDGTETAPTMMGACNDLFLCRNKRVGRSDYFICNMQTKQRLQLPSPPFDNAYGDLVGFICDPYYSYETGGDGCKVFLNAAYRYSIVVIPFDYIGASEFNAHLFSSTNNKWTEIVLSLPEECLLWAYTHVFGFSGMFHFYTNRGMIGFDPYRIVNNVAQCHRVCRWPSGFPCRLAGIGVREGHLQMCYISYDKKLFIWVLKDYKG